MTIEEQARALLSPVLGECVRQRTEFGKAKYGQTLDHNHQSERAKVIHLMQELLDGVQYACWAGLSSYAWELAQMADDLRCTYNLTVEEIVSGGKH